ncbi:MAG: sensor histidine kinase [Thermoanaerobaculia bacterium]
MFRLVPDRKELGFTPYLWLVYVVPFALGPFLTATSPTERGATVLAAAFFLVLYFRAFWEKGARLLVLLGALVALGLAFEPWNPGAGAFFIYAASFAGGTGRPRAATAVVVFILLVAGAQAWALHFPMTQWIWPMVFTALIGAVNIHFSEVHRGNERLRRAHDEIEHLAKVAERERIARDLHDLLGHTLSVIVLKSELAAKLWEKDPARARDEIRDVERISREALAEVRSAVTGYRSGGLQGEVARAGEMLRSAGVEFTSTFPERLTFPPALETVLALALREAATNVVRHAQARTCAVRLDRSAAAFRLTIEDDGQGGAAPEGSGLRGMRERVEASGGVFHREGTTGTRLTLSFPLTAVSGGGAEADAVSRFPLIDARSGEPA